MNLDQVPTVIVVSVPKGSPHDHPDYVPIDDVIAAIKVREVELTESEQMVLAFLEHHASIEGSDAYAWKGLMA